MSSAAILTTNENHQMKTILFTVFIAYASLPLNLSARQYIVLTDLDRELAGDNKATAISRYMEMHSLNTEQMLGLLDENFHTQLNAVSEDEYKRLVAAESSLYAMAITDKILSLEKMRNYSESKYTEEIRATAGMLYLRNAGADGFVLASNIMTQSWRSPREHNRVRTEYYNLAKSTLSKTRQNYVEFLEWAAAYDRSGGFKTWDRQLIELDPPWRTNRLRRVAIEAQLGRQTTPTGTNILIGLLRDYEISSGSPASEPKLSSLAPIPRPHVTELLPSKTNILATAKPEALRPFHESPVPAAPRSRKPLTVFGVVFLTVCATVFVWFQRQSGGDDDA